LQYEIKTEGQLEFADDYDRQFVSTQCDQIAAANLALDREPERFEVTLDWSVKACLGSP
jgi:hypothetical protein